MSESEAISKVILEFGEARVLNAGMVKVHTMPKMIKGMRCSKRILRIHVIRVIRMIRIMNAATRSKSTQPGYW